MPGADPHERYATTPAELKAVIEAQAAGRAFLAWRDEEARLRLHGLTEAGVVIGRSPASDIALAWDPEVSASHAQVLGLGGTWLVQDDGLSTNGTFVAGERVVGRRRLRDQDRILIGRVILVFHHPAPSVPPTRPGRSMIQRTDLSDIEWAVLLALARPMVLAGSPAPASNAEICAEVSMTPSGVRDCLRRLYRRFDVSGPRGAKRRALVRAARDAGLLMPHAYE